LNILRDINNHLKYTSIVERTIYLNIFIFLLVLLLSFFDFVSFLSLPASFELLLKKPWTIISYSFFHQGFIHLLSNLIILYYMGNLFLDFFSKKKFIIYYLSGAIAGGLFFIAYSQYTGKIGTNPLGGASAAVMAILVGVATKVPHYSLKLRFIGSVELWVFAAIWIVISILGVSGLNSGGAISHLGGASIGFFLTAFFKDATAIENLFKRKPKKSPFQKVYKNNTTTKTKPSYSKKKQNQRKIDAILDKISKSGYDALSKEEKDFLFNQKED